MVMAAALRCALTGPGQRLAAKCFCRHTGRDHTRTTATCNQPSRAGDSSLPSLSNGSAEKLRNPLRAAFFLIDDRTINRFET
jgi:hypothetical protein